MADFTLKSNAFPPGTTVNAYAGQPPQGLGRSFTAGLSYQF